MKVLDYDNLFPQRLRRTATAYFAAGELGAALLKQEPLILAGTAPDAASLDPTVESLLHPHELAQAAGYRLAKRRNEFVAGRVSAKLALGEYWAAQGRQQTLPAVEIVNDPTGRPLVKAVGMAPGGKEAQPPEVSITHGGAYGAALATAAPCGIDLQEQKDTLLRVLDKYCSAEEDGILASSLPDLTPPARLSLLWTAKEAAKKACSHRWMPGFFDLRLTSLVEWQDECYLLRLAVRRPAEQPDLPGRIAVLATTFHQYGLAVCILNGAHRHAGTAGS